MEALIAAGEVSVNGKTARLGMRVGPRDAISVRGELVARGRPAADSRAPRIVLYHKPEGEIVSRDDPEGRPSVFDRAEFLRRGRWLAIGRLDFNTCGLLVFTDSGELANRLSHPRFQARRDYAVRVIGELTEDKLRQLRTGIELEDGPARFELIAPQGGEGSNRWYRVRVREGRNRLVRRMFGSVGSTISRLLRTGFGPFDLPPRLKRGQWLRLEQEEVKQAMKALDLPVERARRTPSAPRGGSRLRGNDVENAIPAQAQRHARGGWNQKRSSKTRPGSRFRGSDAGGIDQTVARPAQARKRAGFHPGAAATRQRRPQRSRAT
jgi:23S rRNA pseudouridine2605 synthase